MGTALIVRVSSLHLGLCAYGNLVCLPRNDMAAYTLGLDYLRGTTMKSNLRLAVYWLTRSAMNGYAEVSISF